MLTYQVRPRIYRHADGASLVFPNDAEVDFFLGPLQPFGSEAGGGRTAVRAHAAKVIFNANTGRHWIESSPPLNPLEVIIVESVRRVTLVGNRLRIEARFEKSSELNELVQSVYFALPMLLSIEFADPVYVERVGGKVGGVPFRWELDNWHMGFQTTTQDIQEGRVLLSWKRFDVLSNPDNRRIVAALHYFHVACRLIRAGNTPWEFMSESILNLSKVLEVLFPPKTGDGKTIDSARAGLAGLAVSETNIERYFIPAMCLRNQIDSAHVDLSLFTRKELATLHAYTQVAEDAFRKLLGLILVKSQCGEYVATPSREPSARREARATIERIAQHCVPVEALSDDVSDEVTGSEGKEGCSTMPST